MGQTSHFPINLDKVSSVFPGYSTRMQQFHKLNKLDESLRKFKIIELRA